MPPQIAPWAFVLAVPDIDQTARYFRDILGFAVLWEDAGDWRLVERGNVRVMLGQCPNDIPPAKLGSHSWFGYLEADDVDALYVEITARGARCTAPADRHYGMREIMVTTQDGHRIVFGQTMGRSAPP